MRKLTMRGLILFGQADGKAKCYAENIVSQNKGFDLAKCGI